MYLQIIRMHGKYWKQRYFDITNLKSCPWHVEGFPTPEPRLVTPKAIMLATKTYRLPKYNPSPINAPYFAIITPVLLPISEVKKLYPEYLI